MAESNTEARIAVLETEVRAINTGHRDVWDAVEKLRSCMSGSVNEIRRDVASTKLWVATGVIGVALPSAAFMFTKLMGW